MSRNVRVTVAKEFRADVEAALKKKKYSFATKTSKNSAHITVSGDVNAPSTEIEQIVKEATTKKAEK